MKLTFPYLKPRKESYILIYSNVSTAKANIKQIAINVHFRNTGSTINGMKRNLKSSKKL